MIIQEQKTISSGAAISLLTVKGKDNQDFNQLLIASLVMAKTNGHQQLDHALFKVLEWPLDLIGYDEYLQKFAKWTPQQSEDKAWKKPGTDHHQEVYDRLCHFYWLIDQPVGLGGTKIVENITWFGDWLVLFAKVWGSYLDTTDSFNQIVLNSFIKYSPQYKVEDSMVNGKPNNPSGWLTFNQFFARELNPGLRPISSPQDNAIVTCPADCTFRAKYDISANSTIPEIIIKKTHKVSSVVDLLEGSMYKNSFANGHFVHYFLGPYSYHRFHVPVAGIVKECYPIKGLVYLDVKIDNKGQFDAPDNSEGGYEFVQARGVITIDTTNSIYGNVGIIAVVPIGMCQVSSVHMIASKDKIAGKCDEFGFFTSQGLRYHCSISSEY